MSKPAQEGPPMLSMVRDVRGLRKPENYNGVSQSNQKNVTS